VLKNYATTDELQHKATAAAKKSLQLKIIGTHALYERFIKNWQVYVNASIIPCGFMCVISRGHDAHILLRQE
jgi:hypothetical protein